MNVCCVVGGRWVHIKSTLTLIYIHAAIIKGIVSELYDVVTLPKVMTSMAIGFKTGEIQRVVSVK